MANRTCPVAKLKSIDIHIGYEMFCLIYRNLESPDLPLYSVKGHKEIINSIDAVGGLGIGEGAPEIVTGSRDGNLIFHS